MNAPAEFLPGIFPAMPAEHYHSVPAMSSGGAKRMLRSPAHFLLQLTKTTEPTPQMQFGTVVHIGVLEPEKFERSVVVAPDVNTRTKERRAERDAFAAAHPGAIVIDAETMARARACIAAVNAHPGAMRLLDAGERELSIFWRDGKYDVPCKARFDARNRGGVIDLKTTIDASPEGFARQAANMLYHVQAAHYCSGAEHVLDASPAFFAFVCVESEAPHAVACYALPGNAIMAGAHLMNIALERYRDALASGKWDGYPDTVETLQLPRWALQFAA